MALMCLAGSVIAGIVGFVKFLRAKNYRVLFFWGWFCTGCVPAPLVVFYYANNYIVNY
jgi:hypothetical protein